MDLSFLTAASTSLGLAHQFGKAVLAVRDFNEMATIVSKLNQQLLDAQNNLFALQGQLIGVREEQRQQLELLREMEQRLKDRGEFVLVDIGKGFCAYQSKSGGIPVTESDPTAPTHLDVFCQPCFDGSGIRSALQPCYWQGGCTGYECRVCSNKFITGERRRLPSSGGWIV